MNTFRKIVAAAVLTAAATVTWAQTPAEIDTALKAAYEKYKGLKEGANADYIPALAKVDSNIYGIALVTVDGKVYTAGDVKSEVSIQSISKVFTMAKVAEEQGPLSLENNMGVDATGQVFNSIVAGAERFPPTEVTEVRRFKNVLHWRGEPDQIRGDEAPTRPYVIIGELKFKENWYDSSNITELVNAHVPRVGGDAVLTYHAYQKAVALVKNPDGAASRNVYYQSIVLEIIRYTDR